MTTAEKPLKALLKQLGWTQERLAAETGIRRTDINAIVNERVAAGPTRRAKIADALGVSLAEVGSPEGQAQDPASQLLRDRLEEVASAVSANAKLIDEMAEELRVLRRRVVVLERSRGTGEPAQGSR